MLTSPDSILKSSEPSRKMTSSLPLRFSDASPNRVYRRRNQHEQATRRASVRRPPTTFLYIMRDRSHTPRAGEVPICETTSTSLYRRRYQRPWAVQVLSAAEANGADPCPAVSPFVNYARGRRDRAAPATLVGTMERYLGKGRVRLGRDVLWFFPLLQCPHGSVSRAGCSSFAPLPVVR